jgi:hypothetical protein
LGRSTKHAHPTLAERAKTWSRELLPAPILEVPCPPGIISNPKRGHGSNSTMRRAIHKTVYRDDEESERRVELAEYDSMNAAVAYKQSQ